MFLPFDTQADFREIVLGAKVLHSTVRLDVDQRFPQLIGMRKSASTTLAQQRVAIVGVGSVGRRIAMHLARLGVKTLWLVDPDRYDDPANLLTQEILATDLGTAEADSTGQACKEISPTTQVLAYEGRVQELDPLTMADADVVFLATDDLAVEIDASYQFRLLGIPLVQAAVHGETLVAQVRFVANQRHDSPCLICSFGSAEYQHLNQSSTFRCSGAGFVGSAEEHVKVIPTISTSFLCSLAADFSVTQWTRDALGLGQPVANTLLQYCGYTHQLFQSELARNPDCRCVHMIFTRVELPLPVGDCTCRELAQLAGCADDTLDGCSFTLGALHFVQRAVCGCQEHRLERFVTQGAAMGNCPVCDGPMTPQPFYTSRPTPGSDLNLQRNRPLRELGGNAAAWAVVRSGQRAVLLRSERGPQTSMFNDREPNHEA